MVPKPTPLPYRLTSARARSMAECRWGRGGTRSYKTNTPHAYFFACSGHGGYVIDGACLSPEQRQTLNQFVEPEKVQTVIRGSHVDFMQNPFSNRTQRYRIRPGQQVVEHPIYLFEEDSAWALLETLTDVRLTNAYKDEAAYTESRQKMFERWYGEKARALGIATPDKPKPSKPTDTQEPAMTQNTRLELTYADADNYKTRLDVVVSGAITAEQIDRIKAALQDGQFAITHQVGLPTPSEQLASEYEFPGEEDHVWTTLDHFKDGTPSPADLLTEEAPTVSVSIDTLVERFERVTWNERKEARRLEGSGLDMSGP